MGVRKDLEKAKLALDEVKKQILKPNVAEAKSGLTKLKNEVKRITTDAAAKQEKNKQGLIALAVKLKSIADAMKIKPFNGNTVLAALAAAETAAAAATTAVKSEG